MASLGEAHGNSRDQGLRCHPRRLSRHRCFLSQASARRTERGLTILAPWRKRGLYAARTRHRFRFPEIGPRLAIDRSGPGAEEYHTNVIVENVPVRKLSSRRDHGGQQIASLESSAALDF